MLQNTYIDSDNESEKSNLFSDSISDNQSIQSENILDKELFQQIHWIQENEIKIRGKIGEGG